jgi:hypothetical protein
MRCAWCETGIEGARVLFTGINSRRTGSSRSFATASAIRATATPPGPNPAADLKFFVGKRMGKNKVHVLSSFGREEGPLLVPTARALFPPHRGRAHCQARALYRICVAAAPCEGGGFTT